MQLTDILMQFYCNLILFDVNGYRILSTEMAPNLRSRAPPPPRAARTLSCSDQDWMIGKHFYSPKLRRDQL